MKSDAFNKAHCMFCGAPAFGWSPDMLFELAPKSGSHTAPSVLMAPISYSEESAAFPLCEMHTIQAVSFCAEYSYDPDVVKRVEFRKNAAERIKALALSIIKESGEDIIDNLHAEMIEKEKENKRAETMCPEWLCSISWDGAPSKELADSLKLGPPTAAHIEHSKFIDFISNRIKHIASRFESHKKQTGMSPNGAHRCAAVAPDAPDRRCTMYVSKDGEVCPKCRPKRPVITKLTDDSNISRLICLIYNDITAPRQ